MQEVPAEFFRNPNIFIYIVGALMILDKLGYYIQRKRNNRNNKNMPEIGKAKMCLEHEIFIKKIQEDNKELKQEIIKQFDKIHAKIDKLNGKQTK